MNRIDMEPRKAIRFSCQAYSLPMADRLVPVALTGQARIGAVLVRVDEGAKTTTAVIIGLIVAL